MALIIGLSVTAAIVVFAELFRSIDLKFFASLTLTAIPFIYIGFSVDPYSLALTIPGAAFFAFLAYWGYRRNYLLTVAGLALHGVWDFLFPQVSSVAPPGYDIFCITIDELLALYFYIRLRPVKKPL